MQIGRNELGSFNGLFGLRISTSLAVFQIEGNIIKTVGATVARIFTTSAGIVSGFAARPGFKRAAARARSFLENGLCLVWGL